DDYGASSDVDEDAVRAMDDELTRKADLVFVASETLLDGKRRLNPCTYVSPHGVDVDHFGQAQDTCVAIPPETAGLQKPVIGFFGLIEPRIDMDLIDYLAQQHPSWTFLLIGRVALPSDQMSRQPNVHLIGKRPYESLPAYGKQFDAAIIPYKNNKFNY